MDSSRSNDGYVVLTVLVITGLLAALVTSLLTVSRPALDLARIGADDTAAQALIEGGLHAAGFLLFTAEKPPVDVDGTSLKFGAGSVDVSVRDESGRVDLNTSDPRLLQGLFSAVGGTSLEAAAFAARVADWRDPDEEVSEGGAEAADYVSAGAAYRPRNGPLTSVGELRLILGLSRRDVDRLEPHVTVYNVSGRIDPFSAGRAVLRAVPDLQQADIAKLLKAQAGGADEREAVSDIVDNHADFFSTEPSGVFRVGLAARLASGARDAAEAVIIAPNNQIVDFGVVSWSRLPSAGRAP